MAEMHIIDQLVHTTIRIETESAQGRGSGTGFFLTFCETGSTRIPAIVTNKHVVEGAHRVTFQFTQATTGTREPIIGSLIETVVTPSDGQWLFHHDKDVDLCIFLFGSIVEKMNAEGRPIYYRNFTMEDVADDNFYSTLVAIEDVLMIGYPSGLWDSKHNFPIVRRGVTATPPSVPFEGTPNFVIDCACFPGSSGSPVLLYNPISYFDKETGQTNLGSGRIKLLGVLWAGPQFDSIGEIKVLPVPTTTQPVAHSRIPMNLGYCVRANQLLWFEEQLKDAFSRQSLVSESEDVRK